jgi:hypothetical protein
MEKRLRETRSFRVRLFALAKVVFELLFQLLVQTLVLANHGVPFVLDVIVRADF